ncbi:MAG: hypothetical protein AMS18_13845 [Gemmatimonas sp. SG8_17]|nr:MAG: hypothetical protein AMS18_13845 [Gemmatimonas sp. SG8_17]
MNLVTGNKTYVPALIALLAFSVSLPGTGTAQDDIERAVENAQRSWLDHDMAALVSGSDTVRLRIPGIAPSASLRPGQAARLLEQYVRPTQELSFQVSSLRELSDDHVYAEMVRVYVVKGTDQQREETVLLGFRKIGGRWSLREVRVTP